MQMSRDEHSVLSDSLPLAQLWNSVHRCGLPTEASLGTVERDINLWMYQLLKSDFVGWNSLVCERGNKSRRLNENCL